METFWYFALGVMLIAYVVLDGFDLGAGTAQFWVARGRKDRDTILKCIAPYWDGNEVWLLAAGGVLVMAFPRVYAIAFSGLYLPLMLVLWLLVGRATAIEFRHHFHHPLWGDFWERVFAVSSFLLTVVFGAALGNVIRGFPLNAEGAFFAPLWTDFFISGPVGVLDWFTILFGVASAVILTAHGSNFLAMKTKGQLQQRCRSLAKVMALAIAPLALAVGVAVVYVQPVLGQAYLDTPWMMVLPALTVGALMTMIVYQSREQDWYAFLASSMFIVLSTLCAACGLYPNMVVNTNDVTQSITIYNGGAHEYSLQVALLWWPLGILLCLGYFYNLYRHFSGKVEET